MHPPNSIPFGVNIECDPSFAPWKQFLSLSVISTQQQPQIRPYIPFGFQGTGKALDFLLTQPLMTRGIQQWYGRTPKIRTLQACHNADENSYFRTVAMLVDPDSSRDCALIADARGESHRVALGLIIIHFSALPNDFISSVREGQTPFGTLLINHGIPIQSQHAYYQVLDPHKSLQPYLPQPVESQVSFYYARTNTLRDARTGILLARTFEILPKVE